LSVLIAEDSPDGRLLLKLYLAAGGHAATFTENGSEAFEVFQRSRFDLVLMDLQMPVMDGLTATRLMRDWEREEGREPTPILACTAHALGTERDSSREAGCNRHLAKPISQEELLAVLAEYDRTSITPPDIPEGFEALSAAYLAGVREHCETLAVLFQNKDFATMEEICHNFKGTGSSFGFQEITKLGERLERAAQEGDAARLSAGLEKLAAFLDLVRMDPAAPSANAPLFREDAGWQGRFREPRHQTPLDLPSRACDSR
jgi:CheY-like chemotaxis protein